MSVFVKLIAATPEADRVVAAAAKICPEAVAQNVAETLETMMPHHGYCLAPTHYLQDNTPVENVIAMYQTAHKLGRYGK